MQAWNPSCETTSKDSAPVALQMTQFLVRGRNPANLRSIKERNRALRVVKDKFAFPVFKKWLKFGCFALYSVQKRLHVVRSACNERCVVRILYVKKWKPRGGRKRMLVKENLLDIVEKYRLHSNEQKGG